MRYVTVLFGSTHNVTTSRYALFDLAAESVI